MISLHLLLVAVSTIASQPQQPDEMPWLTYVCARPVSEGPGQVPFESARSLEIRGDYKNALAAFLKAASSGEQWPYCLYLARIYLRLNEPGAAEDTATACSKLAPDCPAAQLTLAYVLGEKGEHARSEEIAERIIDSDPKNAEAWYVSGRNRLAINDETQGAARLRKAIELNSELAHAHLVLGTFYSQEKSTFEQARRSLERAQALGLGNFKLHLQLGALHLKRNQISTALRHLEKAVELNQLAPEAYYLLSRAYRRSGAFRESSEALDRYQQLQEQTSRLNEEIARSQSLYQKGMKLLQERRLEPALEAFSEALGPHPNQDICHYGIAQVLALKGDAGGSIAALQKAIEARPFNAAYYRSLADILHSVQRTAEAIDALSQAVTLEPANGSLQNQLGNLHFATNAFEKARAAYERAIQLDSENALFHLNLSSVLQRLGRVEEAARQRQIFEQLLSTRSSPN